MLGALVLLQIVFGVISWRRSSYVLRGLRRDQELRREAGRNGAVSEALDALVYSAVRRRWIAIILTVHPLLYLLLPAPYRGQPATYITQVVLVALTVLLFQVIVRQENERARLAAFSEGADAARGDS